MKYPIILAEGLDVEPYLSIAEIRYELEIDIVKETTYKAYDAEGRLMELVIDKAQAEKPNFLGNKKTVTYEQINIRPLEIEPTHAEELKQLLLDYFEYSDPSLYKTLKSTNLAELVDALLIKFGKLKE